MRPLNNNCITCKTSSAPGGARTLSSILRGFDCGGGNTSFSLSQTCTRGGRREGKEAERRGRRQGILAPNYLEAVPKTGEVPSCRSKQAQNDAGFHCTAVLARPHPVAVLCTVQLTGDGEDALKPLQLEHSLLAGLRYALPTAAASSPRQKPEPREVDGSVTLSRCIPRPSAHTIKEAHVHLGPRTINSVKARAPAK